MDYFTRMVVESNKEYMIDDEKQNNEDEIVITDSFGFIEKTIEIGKALPFPDELEGEQKERLT